MLTVRDLGGFVRIVDKGKQDGHTSVQDAALFSKIGKNEVAWLGKKMQELLDAYTQQNNSERQPKTFEEVEKIWTEQVTPALNTFKTMQNTGDLPPEDSQWFRQWKLPEIS